MSKKVTLSYFSNVLVMDSTPNGCKHADVPLIHYYTSVRHNGVSVCLRRNIFMSRSSLNKMSFTFCMIKISSCGVRNLTIFNLLGMNIPVMVCELLNIHTEYIRDSSTHRRKLVIEKHFMHISYCQIF